MLLLKPLMSTTTLQGNNTTGLSSAFYYLASKKSTKVPSSAAINELHCNSMASLFPGFLENDQAGPEGEFLETCSPIPWPAEGTVSSQFVSSLLARLLAASYRSPDLLNPFALSKSTLTKLLASVRVLLARESNIVDIVIHPRGKVHIFGDTHGDLHSLAEALSSSGWPSPENVLCFAGDCVDRGAWGVEVLAVILALKLWQPQNVFVLRGNHETTGCVSRYNYSVPFPVRLSTLILPTNHPPVTVP